MRQNRKKIIAILLFFLLDAVGIIYIVVDKKSDLDVSDAAQHVIAQDIGGSQNPALAQISAPVDDIKEVVSTEVTLPQLTYIEIMSGCGPYYESGECVNVRSGPGTEYPVQTRLRSGVVLHVDSIPQESEGLLWYRVIQDDYLRYAERVNGDWYIAVDSEYVRVFTDIGPVDLVDGMATSTKRVLIDLSEEKLYAYDGDELFMEEDISSGLDDTPTPRGNFYVYRKTPSRYMQGPLPGISSQYYDLPGVPWNLYFTYQGAVIHGAYWHDKFGNAWSHGCANLPLASARKLYEWAPLGMEVKVVD